MILLKSKTIAVLAAAAFLACAPALAEEASTARTALVVLEGIGPDTDSAAMKEMAQFLSSAKIPFSIGLRPVKYGKDGKNALLSGNRYLVNNIKALSRDSTILLQGTAGEGPGTLDVEINELVSNDMLPLGFLDIPPAKYAAEYDSISGHFSTILKEAGVSRPVRDDRFQKVIYLRHRFTGGRLDRDILKEAEKVRPAGEPALGVVIGMDVNKDNFLRFIKRIRGRGYTFMDLKRTPNYVRSGGAIIISDTWYYAGFAAGDTVYGGRKKIDLLKFRLDNSYLSERFLSRSGDPFLEKVSETRLNGTALIDIPSGEAIFVARQSSDRPDAAARVRSIVNTLVFGRLSSGPLDDIYRVFVLALFLVTASAAIYIVIMFIQAIMAGRSYRGL